MKTIFLGTMGEAYTRTYLNIGVDQMADTIKTFIKQYDVDGLLMHSNRSCKPYSFGIRHSKTDSGNRYSGFGDRC